MFHDFSDDQRPELFSNQTCSVGMVKLVKHYIKNYEENPVVILQAVVRNMNRKLFVKRFFCSISSKWHLSVKRSVGENYLKGHVVVFPMTGQVDDIFACDFTMKGLKYPLNIPNRLGRSSMLREGE